MFFVVAVLIAIDFSSFLNAFAEFWLFWDFWSDVCFTARAPILTGYFLSLGYLCGSDGNISFGILLYICSHRVARFG